MIEQFNNASELDQVMLVFAAFFAIWFLCNMLAVIFRGGTASALPGLVAALLIITVILT